MLERYFTSSNNEYSIPADIEEYLHHDDHLLMKTLRTSDNIWANKIIRNSIPAKIFETFGLDQLGQLEDLENYLTSENIDFIKCQSNGRLSKYYSDAQDRSNKYPLKVIRSSSIFEEHLLVRNINQATDLFEKFSQSHTVNRIHCDFDELTHGQKASIKEIIKG